MFAGLVVGYCYWMDQTLDRPTSLWAGGIGAFFVLCSIGAIFNGFRAWRDARRVAAAQYEDLRLEEGRVITVCGTIHPIGEPLLAPFTHTPCIACEYDFTSPQKLSSVKDQSNSGSDYAGFLMNPCVIRTQFRDVKLLGFPLMEGFSEQRTYMYTAAGNAREFLQSSEFDDRTGLKLVSVLSVFGDVWSDDDGMVRKNIKIGKVTVDEIFTPDLMAAIAAEQAEGLEAPEGTAEDEDEEELDDEDEDFEADYDDRAPLPKMVEKRVGIGEEVCAIGVYDEVRGGLVPHSRGGQPNRLIRGDAETIVRKSRSSSWTNLIGGTITLALVHAALFGLSYLYVRAPEVIRDRERQLKNAISNGQVDKLEPIFRRGFDVNHQDSEGNTLLYISHSPEVT
ncbi:MAG TPA: hypothetical protein VFG14_00700, partial [Chthoniobacteraceae bacterium]|nr:hypothetical protein [Chthoniobacteraceae bacterium]